MNANQQQQSAHKAVNFSGATPDLPAEGSGADYSHIGAQERWGCLSFWDGFGSAAAAVQSPECQREHSLEAMYGGVAVVVAVLAVVAAGVAWKRRKAIAQRSLSAAASAYVSAEKARGRAASGWRRAVEAAREKAKPQDTAQLLQGENQDSGQDS